MKKILSLVLVLLMITTMIPIGMTASAETAPTWVLEDFEDLSDCSVSGLTGQTTETVDGVKVVTGTSTGIGFTKSFNPAVSITEYDVNYLALKMKFYIEDPTVMKTAGAPQIELTSSGKCDVNELHWVFSSISLQPGWNDLLLDFSAGVATGGQLDITKINYMRIYTFFSAETKAGFGPMEIVTTHGGANFDGSFAIVKDDMTALPQSAEGWFKPGDYEKDELLISDFDNTDTIPVTDSGTNTKVYTVDGGASVLSCNVPAGQWISLRHESMPSTSGITLPTGYDLNELGLAFRLYIEDVTAVKSVNIELSNSKMDTNEIWWNLEGVNAVQQLQNGWNEVILPFSSYSGNTGGEFTVSQIKWWRFNFNNTATGSNVYKLDYLKIVPLKADSSLMIVDFTGNETLKIADSCGTNTKVYTTEDGATILNCTTSGGQWISLKQEGLPNTAGIALPEGYTMDELALNIRVYIQDVSAIKAANVEIASTKMDTNEISWNLTGLNKVQQLQNGWNELVLPFSSYSTNSNGEFALTQIKWWRFNFDNTATGSNVYKLDYIKVLPLVEKDDGANDKELAKRTYLFSYTDTADQSQGLYADNEGLLYWLDGDKTVSTGAYLAPNTWSHVAYTLDPATKALVVYINGQAASTTTLTADQPGAGTFKIGIGPNGFDGKVFDGKIGDVRVWTDVRTADEIAGNYQVLINAPTDGLYANWRLNEDMGFVATVPQDHVGTNHASVLWRDWTGDWIEYEEPTDYDYTFVAVPDPQILAASYPDIYQKLFQYIADNAESQKIKYVLGLGDLTDGNGLGEWDTVREAFDRIEGMVPYANILGNHDYGNWSQPVRDTERYNNTFLYEDHIERDDWGGAYEEGKLDNVYYCFNVGEIPYMVVCLEFLPRDGVIEWANQVVAANPDRNVIVLTHGYINGTTGEVDSEPQSDYGFIINNPDPYNGGKKIWEKFISQHKNIVMSMCGHTFCKDDNVIMRADAGVNGNTVIQLCLNAQTMDSNYFAKTGVGMLGLLRFSENGQKVALQYYSPHTGMCFREVNQFSFVLQEVTAQKKAADQAAAQVVVDQIDQLNVQSLDDKAGVVAARAAYDALTDAQKEYVTNLDKLAAAERAIAELEASQADKDAAKAVEDQIEAMDATDPQAVADARTAYNNLSDLQKLLVPNLQKLLDAEEALKPADITYGDVNGDNAVDAKDALMILQSAVNKIQLTEAQAAAAEVSGDNAIDAKDALYVLQKAVDKIEKFPVEK